MRRTTFAKNKVQSIAKKQAGTILQCPLETKDGKRAGRGGSIEKSEEGCTKKSKGKQSRWPTNQLLFFRKATLPWMLEEKAWSVADMEYAVNVRQPCWEEPINKAFYFFLLKE